MILTVCLSIAAMAVYLTLEPRRPYRAPQPPSLPPTPQSTEETENAPPRAWTAAIPLPADGEWLREYLEPLDNVAVDDGVHVLGHLLLKQAEGQDWAWCCVHIYESEEAVAADDPAAVLLGLADYVEQEAAIIVANQKTFVGAGAQLLAVRLVDLAERGGYDTLSACSVHAKWGRNIFVTNEPLPLGRRSP